MRLSVGLTYITLPIIYNIKFLIKRTDYLKKNKNKTIIFSVLNILPYRILKSVDLEITSR